MKTRRHHHVSKVYGLFMSQRNTRLKKKKNKTSMNRRRRRVNSSEPIPIDLIIEILSRVPAKSIARFRSVSKLWASTLHLPYFTELYLTRSSARPRLFFSCYKSGELILFSAPQDQHLSLVTASYHMKFPFNDSYRNAGSFDHLCGLTCHTSLRILNGIEKEMVSVIYKPSTGEYLNLPKVKTRYNSVKIFLGYDPIDKQLKVLSMTWSPCEVHRFIEKPQVLTLGTTTNQWRRIESSKLHYACGKAICIDGGLYYHAYVANGISKDAMIVWFDVRYEKFRFFYSSVDIWRMIKCSIPSIGSTLINYKGKLGAICSVGVWEPTGDYKSFHLLVLVDAEKQEWSKHVYVLPSFWKNVVNRLSFVIGVIAGTNEILLAQKDPSDHFYVYYYDLDKKTLRRVEIQGMDAVKVHRVDTFLDHIEDVKLLQMF